jgi:MinD-like ATPase involved in chromosome partitioning or flagellar assembly
MSDDERDLVEVPENAMREVPLAFGLTAPQLGLAGLAAAVGFVINLLPIWLPLRLTLAVVVAAPIFGTAIVSIRGEPGHRWLLRFLRYARSEKHWVVPSPATPDPSDGPALPQPPAAPNSKQGAAPLGPAAASDSKPAAKLRERGPRSEKPARPRTKPARVRSEQAMPDKPVRLRVVSDKTEEPAGSDEEDQPQQAPAPDSAGLPHLLRGFRLVCFLSFAGGVGKTTLAVETASLVGSVGRYVAQDGSEAPVRVLLLDATRFAPAAAIRLGVAPKDLSSAWSPDAWRDPAVVRRFVVPTRYGVEVLTLPQHPRASGRDLVFENPDNEFLAGGAQTLLDAAHESDTALVVADLGSAIDEGHRQLIEHADLVLGVVRPTTESLADAYRLASMVRGLHAGRKLALVANQADDDREAGQVARDAGLDLLAAIPRDPTFERAAEVGEPAWRLKPELREALVPLARIVWPFFVERNGHRHVSGGVLRNLLSGAHR